MSWFHKKKPASDDTPAEAADAAATVTRLDRIDRRAVDRVIAARRRRKAERDAAEQAEPSE